jgi:hypothetical protein
MINIEAKIMLGMPTTKVVNYNTVSSMMGLGSIYLKNTCLIDCCLIYNARRIIVEEAIKHNNTHIFFMDSDMVINSGDLDRLLMHDKDIVSMMAFKRQPPYYPCFYKNVDENGEYLPFYEWDKNSLIEVVGVGLACCLVKVDIFKKLGSNCFMPGVNGEDLSFCERARNEGYKIYVDTSISSGHVESEIITDVNYLMYREHLKEQGKL